MKNNSLRLALSFFILIIPFITFAQPDLTLWRLAESAQTTHDQHGNDEVEFYDCGSRYYAIIDDENAEHITTWSIRNDGDVELTFDLPLTFSGASERFSIVQQPSVSTLQANEEIHFTLKYEGVDSEEYAYLNLKSNDPSENSCVYAFDAGARAADVCVCDGNNQVLNIFTKKFGGTTGIQIGTGRDCPPDGFSCQPISILDPTDCSKLITTPSGIQLFADTLTINALPGINFFTLLANNTPNGLADANGVPYTTPLNFVKPSVFAVPPFVVNLSEPSPGVYKIPFFRYPDTHTSISLNGTPFVSMQAAPALASCSKSIPTISEWGLIILGISMLIIGLVAVENRLAFKTS